MRIPRNLSGDDLIKLLRKYGYHPIHQVGSHIRLSTQLNGEHRVTVPNHSPISIGTLSSILSDIAMHLGKTKSELMNEMFG